MPMLSVGLRMAEYASGTWLRYNCSLWYWLWASREYVGSAPLEQETKPWVFVCHVHEITAPISWSPRHSWWAWYWLKHAVGDIYQLGLYFIFSGRCGSLIVRVFLLIAGQFATLPVQTKVPLGPNSCCTQTCIYFPMKKLLWSCDIQEVHRKLYPSNQLLCYKRWCFCLPPTLVT